MEPTEEIIRTDIRNFLIENFLLGKKVAAIMDGESLLDAGVVDSTGILELVGFVEQKWGVQAEDSDLLPENFDSVDNLTRYVLKKMGPK